MAGIKLSGECAMKRSRLKVLRTAAGAILMSLGINGCSVLGGETIGLAAFYKGAYDIYHIALFDEQNGAWGFRQFDKRESSEGRPLTFPVFTREEYMPDNQKRLPEKVRLVWLSAPHYSDFTSEDKAKIASFNYPPARVLLAREQIEDMNRFKDSRFNHPHPNPPKVYGPYEFDIRSRIPPSVLRKVKGSWDYGLGVTVEFTETYQKVIWSLRERNPKTPPGTPNNPICVGGQLDVAQGQKILNWTVGTTAYAAPIWPHCNI
jgi:hypothetical protein